MSGFFRNTPSKKSNVFTFPPPDLGMLRRSRRVLIFPKSRCIMYFDLRVPDYSNMVSEKGKNKLNLCTATAQRTPLTQSEVCLFFYNSAADGISIEHNID